MVLGGDGVRHCCLGGCRHGINIFHTKFRSLHGRGYYNRSNNLSCIDVLYGRMDGNKIVNLYLIQIFNNIKNLIMEGFFSP